MAEAVNLAETTDTRWVAKSRANEVMNQLRITIDAAEAAGVDAAALEAARELLYAEEAGAGGAAAAGVRRQLINLINTNE